MKRRLLSLALALCLAASLTACGGSKTPEASTGTSGSAAEAGGGTVTLGMIGPLTGSLAVYGTHIENGVKLAIEEINAAGGVTLSDGAYQLAVETKDDQGDSTECVNAMNALISDGVQLVVGSATSGCSHHLHRQLRACGADHPLRHGGLPDHRHGLCVPHLLPGLLPG